MRIAVLTCSIASTAAESLKGLVTGSYSAYMEALDAAQIGFVT